MAGSTSINPEFFPPPGDPSKKPGRTVKEVYRDDACSHCTPLKAEETPKEVIVGLDPI